MNTYLDTQYTQVDGEVAKAMKAFVDSGDFHPFNIELINAIIKQMKGVNNFMVEVALTAVNYPSGLTEGFIDSDDMHQFYQVNKKDILAFFNSHALTAGFDGKNDDISVDYITSWNSIKMQDIDRGAVKAVLILDQTDDEDAPILFAEICFFLIQSLCKCFFEHKRKIDQLA